MKIVSFRPMKLSHQAASPRAAAIKQPANESESQQHA